MHELLTGEQREQMLTNGRREQTEDDFDPKPVVKLVLPGLAMTWLLTSVDPDRPDVAYGLCDLGFGTPELGSVSLDELAAGAGPLAPKVRRDPGFVACKPISAYAADARTLRHPRPIRTPARRASRARDGVACPGDR